MANFTPEQIEQFLEQFFDVVGRRQYIGARYVPIFGRKDESSIEWDNTKPYEPLTIVLYHGNSYTSRTYVPTGVAITNTTYWAETGNYNAQVEAYRQEVLEFDERITNLDSIVNEKLFIFENVAEMAASDMLFNGAHCRTSGYYANGDGGGCYYVIGENQTPNGMDIIQCGPLVAVAVFDGSIDPKQVGAKGDGTHDDSNAINRAIEIALEKSLKILLRGFYYITNTINFVGEHIYVDGANSMILYGGSRDKSVVKISGYRGNYEFGSICDGSCYDFSDSTLDYEVWHGWDSEEYVGIEVYNFLYNTLTFKEIVNITTGIRLSGKTVDGNATHVAWNTFNGGNFYNCKTGLELKYVNSDSWLNANTFNNFSANWHSAGTIFVNSVNHIRRLLWQHQETITNRVVSCNGNSFNHFCFEFNGNGGYRGLEIQTCTKSAMNNPRIELYNNSDKTIFFAYVSAIDDLSATQYVNMKVIEPEAIAGAQLIYNNTKLNFEGAYHIMEWELKNVFIDTRKTSKAIKSSYNSMKGFLMSSFYQQALGDFKGGNTMPSVPEIFDATNGAPTVWVTFPDDSLCHAFSIEGGSIMSHMRGYDSQKEILNEASTIHYYVKNTTNNLQPNSGNTDYPGHLVFPPTVKYVKIFLTSRDIYKFKVPYGTVISKTPPELTYFIDEEAFISETIPTATNLPIGTIVYQIDSNSFTGSYWVYERDGSAYSWVLHS